jgi:hypothetical protein
MERCQFLVYGGKKQMTKLKWLTVVIGALALLVSWAPVTAHAQTSSEPAGFKNVTLWIYPEYDDPRLLVMLEGKISGATAPVRVRFLVPQSAEMYSAGSKDAQGNYSGGPPDRKASQIAGWDEISYQLTTDTFRVEYYYPGITGQTDKQISFDYHWLYPVADLNVVVQQPLKATSFSVTPAGQKGTEGQFAVQNFAYTNLTPEQPVHYEIKYTKTDAAPSLGTIVSTPGPGSSSTNSNTVLIVVIAVLASLLLIGGVFLWFRIPARTRVRRPDLSAPSRAATSRPKTGSAKPGRAKYCNYCGKQLDPESNFCAQCGKKLAGKP